MHWKPPDVVFVNSPDGDWAGVYVDGKLKYQNHTIHKYRLMEALGLRFTTVEVNQDWLEANGLPENVGDVRKAMP